MSSFFSSTRAKSPCLRTNCPVFLFFIMWCHHVLISLKPSLPFPCKVLAVVFAQTHPPHFREERLLNSPGVGFHGTCLTNSKVFKVIVITIIFFFSRSFYFFLMRQHEERLRGSELSKQMRVWSFYFFASSEKFPVL